MRASEVLDAVEAWHSGAAFVRELTVADSAHSAAIANLPPDTPTEVRNAVAQSTPGTRRIDALMFDNLQRTAIEVKVSVADARREDHHKIAPWQDITHRYIYVTPAGLIENPPVWGCGLWWVHPDGKVEVRRKATINRFAEPLPQRVVQTLAYRACGRTTIQPQTTESAGLLGSVNWAGV